MGRLTTHVLDMAQGRPAAGMTIELVRLDGDGPTPLKTVTTNADGRTAEPLLCGADLEPGAYELVFEVGAYFADQPVAKSEPPFLDRVPVRFSIGEGTFHVPLLCSPWSYSTYLGS
jgi:5-hydroxyisourate hydrolase